MRMVSSAGFGQFRYPASATPSTQGFPVALDATKTFFLDQRGNPCFGCGDAPQYIIEELSPPDVELYLSDRRARGMNIGWTIAVDATATTNYNGDVAFSGARFTNFQTAYWNYVDYIVGRFLAYGMTAVFMPAFMGVSGQGDDLDNWKNSSDSVLQNYAAFIGARYSSFKNLMYTVGGDADPADTTCYAKLNTFATALKAADPNHLITLEAARFGGTAPNGGYSSVDALTIALGSVPSWLDINWVYQSATTCGSGAQRCYTQGKPCLMGEDFYELEHSMTSQGLRAEGYAAILGGCTLGRLFGNGTIWPFNASFGLTSPPWQTQLASQGSTDQQRLGNLFRSRAHHKLVPDIAGSVMTVGASNGSFCARTNDGQSIIAYLPSSQTITIDMSKITDAGSSAACNWFNPQTGAVTNIGNFANSSTKNFTSPDSNDWVLVIDSNAAGLRAPGT